MISNVIKRWANQKAVYWAPSGHDGEEITYSDPVEIDCRWEERSETVKDAMGREFVTRAVVFPLVDVAHLGRLYLGRLYELTADEKADPSSVMTAYEIKRFNKIPDLAGTDFVRKIYL